MFALSVARCARLERDKREARRPDLERHVWVGSDGTRTPFLDLQPNYFVAAITRLLQSALTMSRITSAPASPVTRRSSA